MVNSRCAELTGHVKLFLCCPQARCRGRSQNHITGMNITKILDPDGRGIHLVVDSDIPFLYLKESNITESIRLAHGLKLETA